MLDDYNDNKIENEQEQHNQPSAEMETSRAESTSQPLDPVMELPEIPGPLPQEEPAYVQAELHASGSGKRSRSGWKMFAAAVALVAMGAGVGSATTWGLSQKYAASATPIGYKPAPITTQTVAATPGAGTNVIPGIYQRVSPSVVAIHVKISQGWQQGEASGSGFVVDPRGYILTNNHVVQGGKNITVKFIDGTTLDGTVVGSDPHKDLAVIKVDPGNRSLIAATLGDSDAVQVGELAVAIGSPFDEEFTVTSGIISAVNRDLQEQNNPFPIPGGLQTDAAINPGNSGGPLLNGNGEVIGINTLIETGDSGIAANIGIGFAVPINLAKEILPTLIAGKNITYPFLGVGTMDLTPDIAQQFNLNVTEGALVTSVVADSPADLIGLQPGRVTQNGVVRSLGDIITAIDGKPMKSADDVLKFIQTKKVGDTIQVTVVRGRQSQTLKATLADRAKFDNQQ